MTWSRDYLRDKKWIMTREEIIARVRRELNDKSSPWNSAALGRLLGCPPDYSPSTWIAGKCLNLSSDIQPGEQVKMSRGLLLLECGAVRPEHMDTGKRGHKPKVPVMQAPTKPYRVERQLVLGKGPIRVKTTVTKLPTPEQLYKE